MLLQRLPHAFKLLINFWHALGELTQLHGRANSRHYIFSLSIEEKITEESLLSGGRVACEADPGAGIVASISVHHLDHIHGGAKKACDLFHPAIGLRFFSHPGFENRANGAPKLLVRIFREWLTGFFLEILFIFAD